MAYYFAYGSCMSEKDLARTVNAKKIGVVRAYGYRLDFTRYSATRQGGVADIVKSKRTDFVEGVLFHVPNFVGLDAREGHPFVYKRTKIDVVDMETGELLTVSTYAVVNKVHFTVLPSREYMEIIWEGAKCLSKEYRYNMRDFFNDIVAQKNTERMLRKARSKNKVRRVGEKIVYLDAIPY